MHNGKASKINNDGTIRAAAIVKASEVHRSDNDVDDVMGCVTNRTIRRLSGLKSDNRNSADSL